PVAAGGKATFTTPPAAGARSKVVGGAANVGEPAGVPHTHRTARPGFVAPEGSGPREAEKGVPKAEARGAAAVVRGPRPMRGVAGWRGGCTGSWLVIWIPASYGRGVSAGASNSAVTTALPPAGTVPDSGDTCSHAGAALRRIARLSCT